MSITQLFSRLKRLRPNRPLFMIVIDENGERLGGGGPPTAEEIAELEKDFDIMVVNIVREDEKPNPDDLAPKPQPTRPA